MWSMTDKIHEIRKAGNLYFLLNSFLGAYNRRTDVMERAVKLDERIHALKEKLDAAGGELQTAIDNQSNKEK